MTKLTSNKKQNDLGGASFIRSANFASLNMPPLISDNDSSKVINNSYQTENSTASAPTSSSKTIAIRRIASNMAAAKHETTPHCRQCPFPSCMHTFHGIDSSYPLLKHLNDFHPIGSDPNGTSFCPVRTCEYAVLGFTGLETCMQHLSLHHDPSRPFADYSTERGIAVAEKPVSEEAKGLCEECCAEKQSPLPSESAAGDYIHGDPANFESPGHGIDSDESCSESESYGAASFAGIMNSIATDLLSVLGHDLALLARLLPQIHASLQAQLCYENTSYAGSDYNTGMDNVGDCGSLASSKTRKSSTSSSLGKRGRDEREPDDDEDNGNDGLPKKLRGRPEPTETRGVRYACPFHKRDPNFYSTATGTRYRSCSGPGQTEVRRLKEHLQNIHRRSFYGMSNNLSDEPSGHNREPTALQQQSDFSVDTIDDSQWVQIGEILRVRRKNDKSDVKKWFELWNVLFPNDDEPSHPYHDHASTMIPKSSHDIESTVGLVQNFLVEAAEGIGYNLDSGTAYLTLNAMRRALAVERVTARHAPGLSLNIGASVSPLFEAYTMPEVQPTQLGASSALPSHVDPAVLGLVSSSGQQRIWQPHFSFDNEYNATLNPAFSMAPEAGFTPWQANTGGQAELPQCIQHEHRGSQNSFLGISYRPQPGEETLYDVPIRASSTSPSRNISAPQAIQWSHNQPLHRQVASNSPSTLNARHTQTQYTAASDNFESRELPELNVQLDSVCHLLELELGATSNEQYK